MVCNTEREAVHKRSNRSAAPGVAKLLRSALDSLESHIAVIDRSGSIRYVNKTWCDFGAENGITSGHQWVGTNYLDVCRSTDGVDDVDGESVHAGIASVLAGHLASFHYEYPCHSPTQQRWFMMSITPVQEAEGYFVISHSDITQRKLVEQRIERLNEKLASLAGTDQLTRLANRLRLDEALAREIARVGRYESKLSLIMLDVDHFKEVNDQFGHATGDAVLIGIAEILRTCVRATDVAGRWGGEEFLIILPECDSEAAKQMAEKLREEIAIHRFPDIGKLTCSFGIADHKFGQDGAMLLSLADVALYRAKNNGRNRVEMFCGPVPERRCVLN